MFDPILPGCEVVQGIMRPFFVVLSYPVFGDLSHFIQRSEHVHIQDFIAVGSIEALHIGVLRRLARLDKLQFNAVFLCPLSQRC